MEPAGDAAMAAGEGGARAFRLLLERAADWLGGAAEGVRAVTWELMFGLRHDVRAADERSACPSMCCCVYVCVYVVCIYICTLA